MTNENKPTRYERNKAYLQKTGYASAKKYIKEKTTSLHLVLVHNTEQDIIQKLASVPNKSGYIKNLIREDIKKTM